MPYLEFSTIFTYDTTRCFVLTGDDDDNDGRQRIPIRFFQLHIFSYFMVVKIVEILIDRWDHFSSNSERVEHDSGIAFWLSFKSRGFRRFQHTLN
jgi:hypothetical protein